MEFDEYQKIIQRFDLSDFEKWKKRQDIREVAFMEKALGLAGEAGEVTDKFKKIIRDQEGKMSAADKMAVEKELGDILWYVATVARYLDMPLSEVAMLNVAKLTGRAVEGKIHGSGDNR